MRVFEQNNNFLHPYFCECINYSEVEKAFMRTGFKSAIIKPFDSQSSRGVFKITSGKNCSNEYDAAKKSSQIGGVIFEEYIDGEEFSIDGLMLRGQYYTLAISRKKHYSYNAQIASDLLFSWHDEEYNYDDLERINREHILRTNLPFGLTHSEYKFKDGKFYLIEMAARGGGTLISSDIAPYMSGIDGPAELIRFLSGEENILSYNKERKMALLHFFDVPQGMVKRIRGDELIRNMKGIHKLQLDFSVGDYIRRPDNDRGRAGFVIIFGSNKDEIEERLMTIEENLHIDVE